MTYYSMSVQGQCIQYVLFRNILRDLYCLNKENLTSEYGLCLLGKMKYISIEMVI